jgi:Fe2+ transport system protein FeoA
MSAVSEMVLPLELLRSGDCAVIEDVQGEPCWIGRMAEMGIRNGCLLQMLQPGSPCLLNVGGCRLCLRGEESMRIMVRPMQD